MPINIKLSNRNCGKLRHGEIKIMEDKDLVLEKEYEFSANKDFANPVTGRLIYINNSNPYDNRYIFINKRGVACVYKYIREVEVKPKFIETDIKLDEQSKAPTTTHPFSNISMYATDALIYGAIGFVFDELPKRAFTQPVRYLTDNLIFFATDMDILNNGKAKPIYAKKILWLNK